MRNHTTVRLENVIYVLIWLAVFAVPVFGFHTSDGVRWNKVLRLWLNITPFLVLFALNNYLLIPYLLLRKRYLIYILSAVALIVLLFTAIPLVSGKHANKFPPFRELPDHIMFGERNDSIIPGRFPWPDNTPHPMHPDNMSQSPHPDIRPRIMRPENMPPPPFPEDSLHSGYMSGRAFAPPFHEKPAILPLLPMPVRWGLMLNNWLLAILLIGFNVAIRLMFNSISDARRMDELERRSLRSELDHLKAQVNPHFLMNTLNNIHALIDIDDELAKGTVIELSKIMRYMLYETDKQLVPLHCEVEFLKNYTSLMSIRYTDDVRIETFYPDSDTGSISIPPLLLIPLLENAFKHGINGRSGSYIYARLSVLDNSLVYTVRNRMTPDGAPEPGVGLENLRKRLGLIYGDRYTLETTILTGEYTAELTIPLVI